MIENVVREIKCTFFFYKKKLVFTYVIIFRLVFSLLIIIVCWIIIVVFFHQTLLSINFDSKNIIFMSSFLKDNLFTCLLRHYMEITLGSTEHVYDEIIIVFQSHTFAFLGQTREPDSFISGGVVFQTFSRFSNLSPCFVSSTSTSPLPLSSSNHSHLLLLYKSLNISVSL